jgi:hypothetical protein
VDCELTVSIVCLRLLLFLGGIVLGPPFPMLTGAGLHFTWLTLISCEVSSDAASTRIAYRMCSVSSCPWLLLLLLLLLSPLNRGGAAAALSAADALLSSSMQLLSSLVQLATASLASRRVPSDKSLPTIPSNSVEPPTLPRSSSTIACSCRTLALMLSLAWSDAESITCSSPPLLASTFVSPSLSLQVHPHSSSTSPCSPIEVFCHVQLQSNRVWRYAESIASQSVLGQKPTVVDDLRLCLCLCFCLCWCWCWCWCWCCCWKEEQPID